MRRDPAQYYKMEISNKAEDQAAMAKREYIHWQDEGVEKIPPNEAEDIQAVADQINAMQKAQYNSHRHCYTGMTNPLDQKVWLTMVRHSRSDSRHRQRHADRQR